MIRLVVVLLFTLSAAPVWASETWTMVWVARSNNWFIKEGGGELQRTGNVLKGVLDGTDGFSKYDVTVTLSKNKAEGTLEVIPSDSGKDELKGTYKMIRAPDKSCSETIQLYNGYNYVGLLRDAKCEP